MANQKVNKIYLSDIKRDPSSYIDPQGFVFHYQDEIYRCVYAHCAPHFRELLENGSVSRLEKEFNLVSSTLSDLEIVEIPDAVIFKHAKIWPLSYPTEWCPSMLHSAAKTTLDLAIEVTDQDLMLQDAYPWNILFKGTTPVFVDLTSIATADTKTLWPAHEQFEAFFLRPLILSKQGKSFCSQALMYDYINGISLQKFVSLLKPTFNLSHLRFKIFLWLDKKLQKSTKVKEKIRLLAEKSMKNITPNIRKRFLHKVLKNLGDPPKVDKSDPWHDYYAGIDDEFDKEFKIKMVGDLLREMAPETVLDIGCNTGVFSIEAAKKGACVMSLDSSESCVERLYQIASKDKLKITPLVVDILSPTPAFGYMSEQYPSLMERAKSDCVLFLGIMHHIHISGRQSFERIAKMLEKLASKSLIFEFVSMQDANIPHLSKRRIIDYSEDSVRIELAKYFKKIVVHKSDRNSRSLFLCTK